jgi:hypothetical protein
MSGHRDPELDDLFAREPGLQRYVNLLRSAQLKPPPLDPNFRPALRRRLMQEAYDRYETRRRPSLFSRLFNGPVFALGTAAVAILVLVTVLIFNNGSSQQVEVTTIGGTRLVAVNQPILVNFSQPMDHHSVENAIQIEPATQVNYSWHGNTLSIQPASGELAPNTQYHVTVAADARTAPGVKIGVAKAIAVTTNPLPPPSPTPSPTPSAAPQITAEHSLAGTSGQIVGWSANGSTLFFVAASGDLDSIGADGSGLKTIQAGVKIASLAPGAAALAYATTGSAGKLYLAASDGSGGHVVDERPADAIGWLGGKPLELSHGDVGPSGAAPTTKLPAPAGTASFSPDGTRLIVVTGGGTGQASPQPITTYLFEIASQKQTSWATPAQAITWSPDSAKVAFWRGGSVYSAAADGSGATELAKSPQPTETAWSADGKLLLLAGGAGAALVKADGSNPAQLSQASFQGPVWAPGGGQFAFLRSGSIWIDDVAIAGTALNLGAAGDIVNQYEQARVHNDAATATGLLGPSASPVAPSPLAADLKLSRFFVISSQATAKDVHFTVRLIFSRSASEVRYQDESLVLVSAGNGAAFKIDSITDQAPHDLGRGPTVISVTAQGGSVVVVFDSDLDQLSVSGSVTLTTGDGQAVPVATAYSNRKLTVTAHVKPGTKYRLTVSNAVKDIAGQALQGGYQYDFVANGPEPSPTP